MVLRCGLDPRCSAISFMTCHSVIKSASWLHTYKIAFPTVISGPYFLALFVIKSARQAHAVENGCLALKHCFKPFHKVIDICGPFSHVLIVGLVHPRNGSRNPRVPIEKLSTGGTAPRLKSDAACRIV